MNNPYISQSIEYFIDREPRYIFRGTTYTREQLDAEYAKTYKHDEEMGYKDRMVGYYDKWYRYNRADQGAAYDAGVKRAAAQENCKEEMIIIPA